MRIIDLAAAIAPDCSRRSIGIRPGEKLHEFLITRDDARHTLEFDDFFVIKPGIHMWDYVQVGRLRRTSGAGRSPTTSNTPAIRMTGGSP